MWLASGGSIAANNSSAISLPECCCLARNGSTRQFQRSSTFRTKCRWPRLYRKRREERAATWIFRICNGTRCSRCPKWLYARCRAKRGTSPWIGGTKRATKSWLHRRYEYGRYYARRWRKPGRWNWWGEYGWRGRLLGATAAARTAAATTSSAGDCKHDCKE